MRPHNPTRQVPGVPHRRCDGWSRRDFLHLGSLAPLGLGLASALRLRAASQAPVPPRNQTQPQAQACILIWLDGGPSHLDMFDPKPDAPSEIRSPFRNIPTAIPGIHICEHLPRTAARLRDIAVIRSLTHELGNHDTGTRFLLTGHRPTPALDHPSLGSIVAHANPHASNSPMPPYLAIPGDVVGGNSGAAGSGFLPGAFSAFNVGRNPSQVPDLHPPPSLRFDRADRQRDMLARLDTLSRAIEENTATRNRDAFYEQAYRLIASPSAKNAFLLDQEPQAVRERYGPSRLGAGCLLARRLVEAGARFVTLVDDGWDTHQQITRELPDSRFPGSGKLPTFDRAYAALLEDLASRGLLASTLVVVMGEFGRTPKINAAGGRDHWPRAGFACLSGAGIRGGQTIGATNPHGEFPVDQPVSPPDLAFTILSRLGINPHHELTTPDGRPVRILNEGSLIRGLS
jgi:hypothetical protein